MTCSKSVRVLLLAVSILVVVREGKTESVRWPRIRPLNLDSSLPELSAYRETLEHSTVEEIIDELQVRITRSCIAYMTLCMVKHTMSCKHTHTRTYTHMHMHTHHTEHGYN